MDMGERTLIIIPAYNEEERLPGVISKTKETSPDVDIIVVDDGSRDGTSKRAADLGIEVIRHPYNLGYGAALQTGFRVALKDGYDLVITMDGDGQHDPLSIPTLIKTHKETGANVVIGSRFLEGSYRMELPRKIGSWIFSKIARLYTGTRFTDPTSGFQLLDQKAFSYLATDADYPLDYPDVNIIMLLHKRNFTIVEAPVRMLENRNGRSMHRGMRPFIYVIRMLLAIVMVLLRKED